METERTIHKVSVDTLPRMPSWVTSARRENLEDVAFLSGATLATLHVVVGHQEVPYALWCDRLRFGATETCVVFSGWPVRAGGRAAKWPRV